MPRTQIYGQARGRDYALGTYPGPTAETLLLTSATAAYRSRAIAAEINSGDKTAFPTPDTDIPSITAAAARHPFFRLNGQRIRNNSSQDFKNIILSYSMSERMIEITPHFVALILSVSEDLQRSPQIVAREFSLGPAKNNFHREFRRAFFIFATHAYHGMFGVRPKTADAKREPNGPATRWVSRLIHIGAARFSSTYPALLQDGAVEDRRWLELAEAAMLDTDLLKAAVKASHLNESWKRWHPPIKQLTR